ELIAQVLDSQPLKLLPRHPASAEVVFFFLELLQRRLPSVADLAEVMQLTTYFFAISAGGVRRERKTGIGLGWLVRCGRAGRMRLAGNDCSSLNRVQSGLPAAC